MIIEHRRLYDVNFSQKVTVTQHGMLPVDECVHSIGRTTAGVFTGLAGFPSLRPVVPSALFLPFTFDIAGGDQGCVSDKREQVYYLLFHKIETCCPLYDYQFTKSTTITTRRQADRVAVKAKAPPLWTSKVRARPG